MKVLIYCQHVLGVGHFFRTLEIVKAIEPFDVMLVTGGASVDAALPDNVRHVELPALMMDENFSDLYSIDSEKTVKDIKSERKKLLLNIIKTEKPDFFFNRTFSLWKESFQF